MDNIDDRYSRQEYTLGRNTQLIISQSKVLVFGYSTLSLEYIKNIVLMGIKYIDIVISDTLQVDNYDQMGMYYPYHNQIPMEEFRKLNPNVILNTIHSDTIYINNTINIKKLQEYNLIIMLQIHFDDGIEINKLIREQNIPFILGGSFGVYGYIFNDFGNKFVINDIDGIEYENLYVEEINNNIVTFKNKHNLARNDIIIADNKEMKVCETINPYKIIINENKLFTHAKKKKNQINKLFHSLENQLNNPNIMIQDYSIDFENYKFLHKINLFFHKFYIKNNTYPTINDITELINQHIPAEFINKIIKSLKGNLLPIHSIIGGVLAQETIKAIVHKYEPIEQWVYFDFTELVEDNINMNVNNKYCGLTPIFSEESIKQIQETKPFIIGAGAIGCELAKLLGMMGIKDFYITDMDTIEKSNLSRQFLFSEKDIHKSKALILQNKIKEFNPDINVIAYEHKVCKETEHIFNKEFHKNINIYLNALDNIDARLYMDMNALLYSKPLIDSGTMGTNGHVQTIIPFKTKSYKDSEDNGEGEENIPICTIKNFPYKPEHTIQWARELFESEFTVLINEINNCDTNKLTPDEISLLLDKLIKYTSDLSAKEICNFIYYENFIRNIDGIREKYKDDLQHKLPIIINENIEEWYIVTEKIINYLWKPKGTKQFNRELFTVYEHKSDKEKRVLLDKIIHGYKNKLIPLQFDKDNENYIKFIHHSSDIRNRNYNIEQIDIFKTKKIAGKIIPALITTTSIIAGYQIIEMIKIILGNETKNRFINTSINYYDGVEPEKIKNKQFNIWTNLITNNDKTKNMIEEIENNYNIKIMFITDANTTIYDGENIVEEIITWIDIHYLDAIILYENHEIMCRITKN